MSSYNYHQQSFRNASVHTSTHRSSTTCSSSSRKQARIEAELELSNLICEDLEVKLARINHIPSSVSEDHISKLRLKLEILEEQEKLLLSLKRAKKQKLFTLTSVTCTLF